jgi:hypothetical protein
MHWQSTLWYSRRNTDCYKNQQDQPQEVVQLLIDLVHLAE